MHASTHACEYADLWKSLVAVVSFLLDYKMGMVLKCSQGNIYH